MSSASRVLVTGGLGFIGSHFVRAWLRGHPRDTVVNLDSETYAADKRRLTDVAGSRRYRLIHGDVADPKVVRRAMKGADYVVHFAAESHVDRSIAEPGAFLRTNVLGTQVLLDAALAERVTRFHHVGTDEVYGTLPLRGGRPFSESSPYAPRSPYAASKAASDHLVRAYHATYGLDVTITSGSNNYGPYQHPEKFIPRIVTHALQGHAVPVYGSGKNVRDWLHVEDYCAAIARVLQRGRSGATYCVGGGAERANIDVAREVLRLLNQPPAQIQRVADRPGHDLRYALDSRRIRSELGWRPTRSFSQGLRETVAWYRDHPEWWKPLKGQTEKDMRRFEASRKTRVIG